MNDETDPGMIERAIALARELQERARVLQTPAERRQQAELDRMLQVPDDKTTLVQLTDRAFRLTPIVRHALNNRARSGLSIFIFDQRAVAFKDIVLSAHLV